MHSSEITELAIKRHDIDAMNFQNVYTRSDKQLLSKRETAFLYGRKLVLNELQSILDELPSCSKILDVGCGTAHLSNWIKEKGFEVHGIEPSTEMFNLAKLNFPEIEIKQAISSELPFPNNSFDLIVSFEVLRYLDKCENRKTFTEFHRTLKNNGKIFVTQVNLFCTDLYFIFHNLKSIRCKITNTPHHHCNFTTARMQKKEIEGAGFKEVETVGRFFGSIRIAFKFGKRIGVVYSSIIEKFSKNQRFSKSFYKNFTGHLIVVAKK